MDAPERVASIDIGSNTIELVVADVFDDQNEVHLEVIRRASVLVGLGDDIADAGSIGATRTQMAGKTLASMAKLAKELGATRLICLATEALRSAENAADVLSHLSMELNGPISVIEGKDEAVLTFWGGMSETGSSVGTVAVVDLGGGSCELVVGEQGEPTWLKSVPLGTSRLIQANRPGDPPSFDDYLSIQATVQTTLFQLPQLHMRIRELIAVGGSATNLAKLKNPGNVPNNLSIGDLEQIKGLLASKPAEEISAQTGIEAKRIRLLVAGVVGWAEIMKWLGVGQVRISMSGIREGSITAWARFGKEWQTVVTGIGDRLVKVHDAN
jgi:exopolyphosphatase/guanosine-5'-triphosphate,3'-diphosphate pyrophosphatase